MAYDRLLESERLIAHGVPDVPFRLSRRRRFIPVGVDVVGDVAATMFIRRGVSGNPWLETWALERRNGAWVVLGGGGADGYEQLFDRRDGIGDICVIHGGGWTARRGAGPFRWPDRGISHTAMRLAQEVGALRLPDRRIAVPVHGLVLVMWTSRRPPNVTAHTNEGAVVGDVPLADRRPTTSSRRPGGWFGYSPGDAGP